MRYLNTLTGGYLRVMDRVLDLQSEAFTLGNAAFGSLGIDLVLKGCAVTDNGNGTVNIAAGLIYIQGATYRYDGGVNIAANGSQTFIIGPAVTSTPRILGDESTKNIYSEQKAIVAAQDPLNFTQIKIGTSLYNLQQYIQDQIYRSETKGTTKEIQDLDGTFAANFDGTGLGITPRWIGWALDNGNNGTRGTAGLALIAQGTYVDPVSGLETVYADGDIVGERLHKLSGGESSKPAGLPPGVNGPHAKPADGGGSNIWYLSGPLQNAADATDGHNNMQPSMAVYRVVKIV